MYDKKKLLVKGLALCALVGLLLTAPVSARAGEADDLQMMIDRARNGVADLERLDELGATRDEATVLRVWLDEAWRLRSEQRYDDVRIVLDRCDAQADMIRQKIETSKHVAEAKRKEEALSRLRQEIVKTKTAINDSKVQKSALEARAQQ